MVIPKNLTLLGQSYFDRRNLKKVSQPNTPRNLKLKGQDSAIYPFVAMILRSVYEINERQNLPARNLRTATGIGDHFSLANLSGSGKNSLIYSISRSTANLPVH